MHFIFLSPCLSPHCLSISSFFLHRSIADLHKPSHHKPIVAELTHFSLSSLFSSFRLCVSGCTCVSGLSALCFGLCVSGYTCVLALCFGLCLGCAGLLFGAWLSVWVCWFFCVLFLLFVTSFDGPGRVVVVQWFLWVWYWLWLCWWLNEILFYCSIYIILLY